MVPPDPRSVPASRGATVLLVHARQPAGRGALRTCGPDFEPESTNSPTTHPPGAVSGTRENSRRAWIRFHLNKIGATYKRLVGDAGSRPGRGSLTSPSEHELALPHSVYRIMEQMVHERQGRCDLAVQPQTIPTTVPRTIQRRRPGTRRTSPPKIITSSIFSVSSRSRSSELRPPNFQVPAK